jgi:hypothetical protein
LALGLVSLTAGSAAADEGVEGDVWYDADGEIAWIDGPAAEPLPPPFVPEWRRREYERRSAAGRADWSDSREWRNTHRFQYFRALPDYGFRHRPHLRHCAPRGRVFFGGRSAFRGVIRTR